MNHNNLILSICSFIGSAASYFLAFIMDSRVMGVIGFVALLVSLYAGYLTIKEKNMSIRHMEDEKKHKSGGRY